MPDRSERRPRTAARVAGRSLYQRVVDVMLTGVAVIVPLVVTVYVLKAAYSFLASAVDPFVRLLGYAVDAAGFEVVGPIDGGVVELDLGVIGQFASLLALVGLIGVVGVVARNRYGEHLINSFDAALMAVPGVGAVYKSFRRMSDVVMESDASNFRDVKLVEFPYDDVYVIGFETNDSPPSVAAAAGEEEMRTLFLPLAPNPFMGGHLTHIPEDRVLDVDLTVEEGVRTVITSGIATPQGDDEIHERPHFSLDHLPDVESIEDLLERDDDRDALFERED